MIIDKNVLAAKLSKLKSIVPNRTTMESMQGVLFENNCLMANNLDIGMIAKLDTNTDEKFIIPLKVVNLITKLPDGEVEITTDKKNVLTIKAKGSKGKYQSFDPSGFIKVCTIEEGKHIKIDGTKLTKALKSVLYAVPDISQRQVFTGVMMKTTNGILDIVGSDGWRIAWAKVEYDGEVDVIIPKATVQKILSLGFNNEVEIVHNKNHAVFISEDYTLFTRLFTDDYIAHRPIFQKDSHETSINRALFADALERMIIATDNIDGTINKSATELAFEKRRLTITRYSSISEYVESLELEEDSIEVKTYINPNFLLEGLKNMNDEYVSLKLLEIRGPHHLIFESEDTMFEGYILPIMSTEQKQ